MDNFNKVFFAVIFMVVMALIAILGKIVITPTDYTSKQYIQSHTSWCIMLTPTPQSTDTPR